MIILIILGYIIAALTILLAVILVVPIEFIVHGEKYEKAFLKARVVWFWGAVGFNFSKVYPEKVQMYLSILGFKKRIEGNKQSKPKKEKKEEEESSRNYLDPVFLRCAFDSLKKILNHIKPKKFIIKGQVGFEDPYHTGVLCTILNILYSQLKKANINIKPVFDEEIQEGKCLIQGRVVLAYMAYIALRLYFSRPVRIKQKTKFKEVKSYGN